MSSSMNPPDPYGTGDQSSGSPSGGSGQPDGSSSGSAPSPYGSTPPSYGSTPPSYGSTPPAYGSQPPAYGSTPPAYGSQPPAYGSEQYGGGYGTPSPYGQPAFYPKNSLGVWSLVLGLVGLVLSCGLFTGIPAIIVGHKARGAVAEGQANNPGMATAGIVLGWIATILSVIGFVVLAIAIASGAFAEFATTDRTTTF